MSDVKKKKMTVAESVRNSFGASKDRGSKVGHTKVDEGYEAKGGFGGAIGRALQKRKSAMGR